MLSNGIVNSSGQHRQIMLRPDRCYVFPNPANITSNTSSLEYEEQPVSRTYQYRKVMKPMLERKRRARINRCLDELKELMLTALQSEGENVSKLEKADILELTVRHLHKLKRQRALGLTPETAYADRFLAGFTHCATEVSQYLASIIQQQQSQLTPKSECGGTNNAVTVAAAHQPTKSEPAIDHSSGVKLLQHLGSCIQRIEHASYRRDDSYANPYSTPPPSPSSHLPLISVESSSILPSSVPVWRPW